MDVLYGQYAMTHSHAESRTRRTYVYRAVERAENMCVGRGVEEFQYGCEISKMVGPIMQDFGKKKTFSRQPLCPLADIITETTFQRENLVTNNMGYFFNHKRAQYPFA